MKKIKESVFIAFALIISPFFCFSQIDTSENSNVHISASADGTMLQFALLEIGNSSEISTPRLSWFWNFGVNLNFELSEKLALFTGLGIKNLGIIYKTDTSTQKYRIYTIGAPIGLKIGKLNKKYTLVGGGVDFPLHYKEKYWVEREDKVKRSEWFSDDVRTFLPYVFAGYRFGSAVTAKVFYYPSNFWSNSYAGNTKGNLLMLTIGMDINRKSSGTFIQVPMPVKKN